MGRPPRAGQWEESLQRLRGTEGEQQQGQEDGSWVFHGHEVAPLAEGVPCPSCRLGCSTVLEDLSVQLGRRKGRMACYQDRYLQAG